MDASEIEGLVTQKEGELSDLHNEMDEYYNLWDLKEVRYETHKTAINITSNRPKTFVNKTHSTLVSSERRISVLMAEEEGEDKRKEMGQLERLFHFALEKADERLTRLPEQTPLMDSLTWFSLVRALVAARILVYKTKKGVIFDFTSWDPRWVTWESGADGLVWANHKTFRSKADIKKSYGKDIGDMLSAPILDFWEGEPGNYTNTIVCESVELSKKILKIPSIPILISPSGVGPPSLVLGTGNIRHFCHSILAPDKATIPLENRLRSMWATHAKRLADQPLINYRKDGGIIIKETVGTPGTVLTLADGLNRLEASPMSEISPTLVSMVDSVSREVEEGTTPNIAFGPSFPSGTALNMALEAGNVVHNPQIRLLGTFYSNICRLIEEQLLALKLKVDVKTMMDKKYYEAEVKPIDLKRPHLIKVEFTARTPWTQMDTYQIAQMAIGVGLPKAFVYEHIVKIPDTNLIADLAALELYEHSPEGAMKRAVEVLMDRGYEFEAQKLVEKMNKMEIQEDMAMIPQGQLGAPSPGAPPQGAP